MLIRFASADVVVLGSGLKRLEGEIQKYELKFVKSADRRLAATLNTHIAAVTITFTKEKRMNPESSLKIQPLEKFPVSMTKEKVAEALGVATHTIPPLVRSGLLKPLGHPGRYCVKHFSRDALAEKFASPEWLDKVAAAIHRHWRNKNARKRARQAQPA